MNTGVNRAADRLLASATLIIGLYVAVSTIILIIECWTPVPIEDSWDELVSGRIITWSWLISQHNEHRLLLPRLVFIVDYWLSAETNVFAFAVGIIELASLGVLVACLSRGAGLRGWVTTMWVTGLTLAYLFWSVQYQTLTWALPLVQFFGVLLAAATTFSMLALGPPWIATLAIVIALEFVAAYTMASGVIVPFVALCLAIWLDRPRSHVAVLSVTTVSVLIAYLAGYTQPKQSNTLLHTLSHLGSTLAYTTAYLGGPFGVSIGWLFQINPVVVAIAAGEIGIGTFAILGWQLHRRRRSDSSHEAVLFALASFVVATGLLTSLGRARFGLWQALASRYATPVVLFWLMLGLLGACRSFGGRRNLAILALAFPALIVVAVSEPHFAETARRSAAERDAATPALLADVADPLLSRLFPNKATPLQQRPILQSAHTSVFSEDWANWIGTPLADHAPFADANSCQGSFDKAVAIIDEAHPGWRAVGWARSVPRGRALHRIVLVDAAGLVRGYGLGGFGPDAQVTGMSALETAEDTGWIGAFTGSDPMSVTAYALLDGNS